MIQATQNAPSNPSITVFLVEDHPAVRQGITLLLNQEGLSVCGHAGTGSAALETLPQLEPTVVMVDLSLDNDESGMDLIATLAERHSSLPVLVYSMHEEGALVERALAFGAKGYVSKRDITDVLITALNQVVQGQTYLSPRAKRSLNKQDVEGVTPDPVPKQLSKQEKRVYTLLGQGLSSPEIAEQLDIRQRTVESYYSRILVKLDLYSVKDLRKHAIAAAKV